MQCELHVPAYTDDNYKKQNTHKHIFMVIEKPPILGSGRSFLSAMFPRVKIKSLSPLTS